MMAEAVLPEPIVTLAEAQAFARIETNEEEALVAGMIRSASALCEAFLGQAVIARQFSEQVPASTQWQRLNSLPVRSIVGVTSGSVALPATAYATDIDSSGQGWVRIIDPSVTGLIEVIGSAGLALSRNSVPEPVRQGVVRLVSHLFAARDGEGGQLPAAVTALWRPYRRMRLY
jgi:uncharacterized phiE125 gp8 family phage protein